ncbi:exopolysaccharide production protein ExoY [Bosea sp. OK403]|uniref:sugar transferase n=1 Tax=Bosea sp. OK403 TaxID=1855286 RepID=UPI0008F27B6B|nr:sugar transferase [Bosea sp. OK403]SFJ61688.1 exopolysaccharide production protein ExoY [Bosea sp. OK403]
MSKLTKSHALSLPVAFGDRILARIASLFKHTTKASIDFSAALTLIFLLFPLLLLIAAMIHYADGGPVLFRQVRVGRGGRQFVCFKFRSMNMDSDRALKEHLEQNPSAAREWRENQKLTHDPRITRIGGLLRKTSLDELPQVFNILLGQMSFVGPRPIVPDEIARYGESFSHCFSVQPGLTGLWQISGRSDCSYAQRISLDSRYANEWGLLLDAKILIRTVPAVLFQHGSR